MGEGMFLYKLLLLPHNENQTNTLMMISIQKQDGEKVRIHWLPSELSARGISKP